MQTIKDFFAHPIIQMALALAVVTVTLAWFSKRVFDEPLRNWELALPAFLGSIWQGLTVKRRECWYGRSWVGIAIVLGAAALVLAANAP